MAIQISIGTSDIDHADYYTAVGHAIVIVVKGKDGSLDIVREVGINADSAEDNQIVGDFIHQVEDKLAEIFDAKEEPKIWTPE